MTKNKTALSLKNKRILVTGGAGFLGSHVVALLKAEKPKEIRIPVSSKQDLRKQEVCAEVVKNIDVVIHLAANVGGIGYNQKFPGTLFYDNLIMGALLMEEARKAKVKKFVAVGTVCAYPKFTKTPFKEEDLWDGYPEETNAPYGLAKKMLLVQAQAYRKEYKFNAIFLLPVNLYGPGDDFSEKSSHVIPALIRRFVEAKQGKKKEVVIWGTGKPTREFLYVEDAAQAIVLATKHFDQDYPVNLGSSYEISIRELAHTIQTIVGYEGKVIFDATKPDGQPKRKLNVEKAKKAFGFTSNTNFAAGLETTIDWYMRSTSHRS